MKFLEWRQSEGLTQQEAADALGVSQPYISRIEAPRKPLIPNEAFIKGAYILSRGAVRPNDFYDMPAWQAELIEAEARAALDRAAA